VELQQVVVSNAIEPAAELLAPAIALRAAAAAAEDYAAASRAAATWRGYESDWRIFTAWCASVSLVAFRVVIDMLAHRDIEQRASRQPRELSIDSADLRSAAARTRCWIYCESTFPSDYEPHTAALMDMSLDEFRTYEIEHRPVMVDMGLLL